MDFLGLLNDKHKIKIFFYSFFLFFLIFSGSGAFAAKSLVFKTKYVKMHYADDLTLKSFIWRVSGKKINLPVDFSLAKNIVDMITERVQSVLDMYPVNFSVDIYLYPEYKHGLIASYNKATNSIQIYADQVTDGVLAHELAHAVINCYFDSPPPERIQEILTQYVDKHLWSDY